MSKYVNHCECGKVLLKNSNKCKSCAKPKKKLPADSVIMKMLETKSMRQVAKELNVSVDTIYKIKMRN